MSTDSADILLPGDMFDIPMEDGTVRRVEVMTTNDEGFRVKFFKPDGTGPFYALLPHGSFPGRPLVRTWNPDERGGQHKSWWQTHPDITGKTGEF